MPLHTFLRSFGVTWKLFQSLTALHTQTSSYSLILKLLARPPITTVPHISLPYQCRTPFDVGTLARRNTLVRCGAGSWVWYVPSLPSWWCQCKSFWRTNHWLILQLHLQFQNIDSVCLTGQDSSSCTILFPVDPRGNWVRFFGQARMFSFGDTGPAIVATSFLPICLFLLLDPIPLNIKGISPAFY